MTRKEGRKEGIGDLAALRVESLRAVLVGCIRRRVRNPATAEDLAQEALLHTIISARRSRLTDEVGIEKLARKIARNATVSHLRGSERRPATNFAFERQAEQHELTFDHTREELIALRPLLEPRLGHQQRRLIALWLDEDVTSVGELAARLQTAPANVRRMLGGISKRISKLTWARSDPDGTLRLRRRPGDEA